MDHLKTPFLPVFFLLLSLFFGLTASAQFSRIPTKLETSPGPEHLKVPDTHVMFIPPAGYQQHEGKATYINGPMQAVINFNEEKLPFYQVLSKFSEESLKERGLSLQAAGLTKVNEVTAFWTTCTGKVLFSEDETILFFLTGDQERTVIIQASVSETHPEEAKAMQKSIESLVFTPEITSDDLLARKPYTVSWEGTQLQRASVTDKVLYLTRDGEFPPRTEDRAYLSILDADNTTLSSDSILQSGFAVRELEKLIGSKLNDLDLRPIEILVLNGLRAFEIQGSFRLAEEGPLLNMLYTGLLTGDGQIYRLIGTSLEGKGPNMISDFRKVSRSFMLK